VSAGEVRASCCEGLKECDKKGYRVGYRAWKKQYCLPPLQHTQGHAFYLDTAVLGLKEERGRMC
jgi:hypothetical protein